MNDNIFISIAAMFLNLAFIRYYKNNYNRKYSYDKKYFLAYNLGAWLFIFFLFGVALDYGGKINFLIYTFPMWGIAPSINFYGLHRLMILKIENNDYNMNDVKLLNKVSGMLKTMYFCSLLLVIIYIYAIIDGRI